MELVLLPTLGCVASSGCVPCAYKILQHHPRVANQRPEMCPRLREGSAGEDDNIYSRARPVLTLGDGDFSFSLALARALLDGRRVKKKRLEEKEKEVVIVATSYETESVVREIYPGVGGTLEELNGFDEVQVCFSVDAASLGAEAFEARGLPTRYQRIIFNFPCIPASDPSQDGQNKEMEENKALLRNFARCASLLLSPDGEIHVTHKTIASFANWDIVGQLLLGGKEINLRHDATIVFDRSCYPPYTNRKARDRKSFPIVDAVTYVFSASSEKKFPSQTSHMVSDEVFPQVSTKPEKPREKLLNFVQDVKESGFRLVAKNSALLECISQAIEEDSKVKKTGGAVDKSVKKKGKRKNVKRKRANDVKGKNKR